MLNISAMNPLTKHALLAVIAEYYSNKFMNRAFTVYDNLLNIADYIENNYSDFTSRNRPSYKRLAEERPTLYRNIIKATEDPDSVSLEVHDLVREFILFTDSLIYNDALAICHKLLAMLDTDPTRAEVMEAGFTKALPHCDYDATDDIISRLRLTSNYGDK